jgi:hypothetical protein
MNISPRIGISLVVAIVLSAAPLGDAAAQCEVCPTTSVVAYQPVAAPIVTPIDPGLIGGWYPGKLLDRWAASRAAYRATAVTTATTATYRPFGTTLPMTSYRPVASHFSRSYMPVSVYRPIVTQPVIATTAYSPITATTAYSPVITSSAVCCDPCSTGTAVSYPSTTNACCGVSAPASSPGGVITPQPALGADVQEPESSYYRSDQSINGSNAAAADSERSLMNEQQNGGSNAGQQSNGGQQQNGAQQNNTQQNGAQQNSSQQDAGSSGASFEAPPLHVPGLPEADEGSLGRTARAGRTEAVAAVYTAPIRPQLVHQGGGLSAPSNNSGGRALPTRAERDAGWSAVD